MSHLISYRSGIIGHVEPGLSDEEFVAQALQRCRAIAEEATLIDNEVNRMLIIGRVERHHDIYVFIPKEKF